MPLSIDMLLIKPRVFRPSLFVNDLESATKKTVFDIELICLIDLKLFRF